MTHREIRPWEIVESSTAFSSPWLRVRKDLVRTNRGSLVDYYIVERFDYVLVVAVTEHARLLTVRQYKHGAGQVVRELPAGYVDDGEDPLATAHRELREETGYEASNIEPLGVLFASPSASCHRAHVFLATGLRRAGAQELDANEKIAVEEMDFQTAVHLAARNQDFCDVSSVSALCMAWHRMQERA